MDERLPPPAAAPPGGPLDGPAPGDRRRSRNAAFLAFWLILAATAGQLAIAVAFPGPGAVRR